FARFNDFSARLTHNLELPSSKSRISAIVPLPMRLRSLRLIITAVLFGSGQSRPGSRFYRSQADLVLPI
ncbi:hypothetical protein, partial [Mesorhizobium sp. M7A.F.Ca.CA.004.05.2.1]